MCNYRRCYLNYISLQPLKHLRQPLHFEACSLQFSPVVGYVLIVIVLT